MEKYKHKHPNLYKVWNTRTGELVISDAAADECAKAMGVTPNGFRAALSRIDVDKKPKWKIERLTSPKMVKPLTATYCVWNNYTDEIVAIDATSEECAKAMGITRTSFYSAVTRSEHGHYHKWHIESSNKRRSNH